MLAVNSSSEIKANPTPAIDRNSDRVTKNAQTKPFTVLFE